MHPSHPNVFLLGGPNGAGKSTVAPYVLRDVLATTEFVNADDIARGLSGFDPSRVAMQAGRVMMERIHALGDERKDFAFETTLASRTFAPWLSRLRDEGYRVHVVYVWVPDAETAVRRVRGRAARGGHSVPAETVRRRFERGLHNFHSLYQPLADHWRVYYNSTRGGPHLVAYGGKVGGKEIRDAECWRRIRAAHAAG